MKPQNLFYFIAIVLFFTNCKEPESSTPPEGLFPKSGQNISEEEASNLIFSWDPTQFRDGRDVSYRIQVYELDSVEVSNDESSNLKYTQILNEEVKNPYFEYGESGVKLKNGMTYAWEVHMVDQEKNEVLIKSFNSFSIGEATVGQGVNCAEGDICCVCWRDPNDCTTKYCRKPNLFICDISAVIHIATVFVAPQSSGGNSRSILRSFNQGPNCDGLIELDNNSTASLIGKILITVPEDKIHLISEDKIDIKAFKGAGIPVPPSDLTINEFKIIKRSGTISSTDFIVKKEHYEKTCVKENGVWINKYQATIIVGLSLNVEMANLLPPASGGIPMYHEIIFDLIDSPNHSGVGHPHDSGAPSNTCSSCPVGTFPKGSYEYYRCFDINELNPNCHQGLHIVRVPLGREKFCHNGRALDPLVQVNDMLLPLPSSLLVD